MAGTLYKKFKKSGYIHKSELRPRPENKNHVTVKDFFVKVKSEVFKHLNNLTDAGFEPCNAPNSDIYNDMVNCPTRMFKDIEKAGEKVSCRYVQEWKDENGKMKMETETESNELIYTHPVTGIMYRKNGDIFEYLANREPDYFHRKARKVWVESGMKRGFILTEGGE